MEGAIAFFMLLSACFFYAGENLSLSMETVSRLDWQENRIPYITLFVIRPEKQAWAKERQRLQI
jgi:hypothetical protein